MSVDMQSGVLPSVVGSVTRSGGSYLGTEPILLPGRMDSIGVSAHKRAPDKAEAIKAMHVSGRICCICGLYDS
jgi:hypothetical protein